MSSTLNKMLCAASVLSAALLMPLSANAEEPAAPEANVRAMALTVEAVVTDIDLETRQVSLKGPDGNTITMTAGEEVVKLEDVSVGDTLQATYLEDCETIDHQAWGNRQFAPRFVENAFRLVSPLL